MQVAIGVMKAVGGVIVNNSSIAALVGEPRLATYAATTIRINAIYPGYTNTRLVAEALASLGDEHEAFAAAAIAAIPMGRLAEPIEIAPGPCPSGLVT